MTELLALGAGLAVPIAGWVATGVLNRRSAAAQLGSIPCCPPTDGSMAPAIGVWISVRAAQVESAIAHMQLLGTRHQVDLADQFARDIATDRSADPEPLLEDLRRTLRRELLLDRVPDRKVWRGRRRPATRHAADQWWVKLLRTSGAPLGPQNIHASGAVPTHSSRCTASSDSRCGGKWTTRRPASVFGGPRKTPASDSASCSAIVRVPGVRVRPHVSVGVRPDV